MNVMDVSHDCEDDDEVLTCLKSSISDDKKQAAEEKKQKQRAVVLRAAEQRQSTLANVGNQKRLGGGPFCSQQPQAAVRTSTYPKRTSQPLEREFFFYYLI